MAEIETDEAIDLENEPKKNWRRDHEDRAKDAESKLAEAEARLQEIERHDSFRQAGIDVNDPQQSYFVKGYDGEVNAESIKQAAFEAGFITEAPTGQAQDPGQQMAQNTLPLDQELAAQQRIANAGAEAQPPNRPDLDDRIRATTNQAELEALLRSEGYQVNVQG